MSAPVRFPIWFRIAPYFLSSLFFLSLFFSVFAPLPLLFFASQVAGVQLLLAILSNTLIVTFLGGLGSGIFFLIFVGVLTGTLSYFLFSLKKSLDRAVIYAVGVVIGTIIGLFLGYSWVSGVNPLDLAEAGVSKWVEQFVALSQQGGQKLQATPEELKRMLLEQSPSGLVVVALVMAWLNSVLFLRVNPLGVREKLKIPADFFKRWKAPEWLIWPTIAAGGSLLLEEGWPALVGVNLLKVCLAIYAIQGLSILAYLLDVLKIRRIFRTVFYVLAVWPFLPVLLATGVFDLWFDFRAKLGQSEKRSKPRDSSPRK